jgi:hypothetical protein
MSFRHLAALVALAGAAACTAPKSKMCREVCSRESECVASRPDLESSFDEGECVAACAALERDPEMRGLVTGRHACVAEASTCADLMDCK